MDGREELALRLANKRQRELQLSDSGYSELLRAVRENPTSFITDPEDEAFSIVSAASERYRASIRGDEFLDDEEYLKTRAKRLERVRSDCAQALAIDPNCVDALLMDAIASHVSSEVEADALAIQLSDLSRDLDRRSGNLALFATADCPDLWDNVEIRPRVRLEAALARAYLDSARYSMAVNVASLLIGMSPCDALGARRTCALAFARLEDEPGLDVLERQFGHRGDSWAQLARIILLFKLGRMPAARRALKGFDRLCEGGSFALLHPAYVETYMPDRPDAVPYSFEEVTMAVHEADPIIVDAPDLPAWADAIPEIHASAEAFAKKNGLDW